MVKYICASSYAVARGTHCFITIFHPTECRNSLLPFFATKKSRGRLVKWCTCQGQKRSLGRTVVSLILQGRTCFVLYTLTRSLHYAVLCLKRWTEAWGILKRRDCIGDVATPRTFYARAWSSPSSEKACAGSREMAPKHVWEVFHSTSSSERWPSKPLHREWS